MKIEFISNLSTMKMIGSQGIVLDEKEHQYLVEITKSTGKVKNGTKILTNKNNVRVLQ